MVDSFDLETLMSAIPRLLHRRATPFPSRSHANERGGLARRIEICRTERLFRSRTTTTTLRRPFSFRARASARHRASKIRRVQVLWRGCHVGCLALMSKAFSPGGGLFA